MGLAGTLPPLSVAPMKVIVTGRQQACRCGKANPVLHFFFDANDVGADGSEVDVSACTRCDGLRAKTPREMR